MSQGKLAGKLCVVTGAGRGLGAAVAQALAAEGAKLVLAARGREGIEAVAKRILDAGGEAHPIPVDVRDEARVEALMQEAAGHGGGSIDVLVNNAGVFVHAARFPRMSADAWDECFDTNLKGAFLCCKHVVGHMPDTGRIINVTSGLAHGPALIPGSPSPGYAPYSVSKLALEGLTQALAQRIHQRVNALNPGVLRTDMSNGLGLPAESVTPAFVWLAAEAPQDVTGRILRADDVLREIGALQRRPRAVGPDGKARVGP